MTRLAPTAALLLALVSTGEAQGNVLVVVADDMGVGEVGAYGIGSDSPPTPNLDALAAAGVRFTNAWASPLCSSTRAQIQTGRLGFRTGVGSVVHAGEPGLPPSEVTLPEMLDRSPAGYSHAAIGKWHLGTTATETANAAGYSYYFGVNDSTSPTNNYFDWRGKQNGMPVSGTDYLTTREVDEALAWIDGAPDPWFVHLAFHAPHAPLVAPPPELHSFTLPPGPPATPAEERLVYKAMVEAMDTEIGRLLTSLGPRLANTTVLFMGDNGTIVYWTAPPYASYQGKATMFEAGVNVPLIVAGPGIVAGGVSDALVHAVDLFRTVAELADVDIETEFPSVAFDSRSLVPYFANPDFPSQRMLMHTELFALDSSGTDFSFYDRAVRDRRFKLARYKGVELFFDLRLDPFEKNNLAGDPLTSRQLFAYQRLSASLFDPDDSEPIDPKLPRGWAP